VTFAPESSKGFFPLNRLHTTAFQIITAAIKHFPRLGEFLQVSGHGVLDEVIGGAACLCG